MSSTRVITLTTDFGTRDGYVGAMKGVILARAPGVTCVDLTHDIPAQDVAAAAFAIAQAAPYFPTGTIHVVVVDPGVGGERRGVVIDGGSQWFIGPDNGVFSVACPAPRGAWEIRSPRFLRERVSATFHGRDVFAAAAAVLAVGAQASAVGPPVELAGVLPGGPPGRVVHVDLFGNLITDLRVGSEAAADAHVHVGQLALPIRRTYADVAPGAPVAYVGSAGTIEIAVRDGSAARELGLGRGARVSLAGPAAP